MNLFVQSVTARLTHRVFMPNLSMPPEGWQAEYIGTPWLWRGQSRAGVDCWGFALLAWQDLMGVRLPFYQDDLDPAAFGDSGGNHPDRNKAVSRLIAAQIPLFETLSQPKPLAITVIRKGAHPLHVGLYAVGGLIVHCSEKVGHVINSPMENLGFGTRASLITDFLWPSASLIEAGRR